MEPTFWQTRWEQGQIGFHEGAPNRFLLRHIERFAANGASVFVPLCGKTTDLDWLAARGLRVTGCELVEQAVRDFFRERNITPVESAVEGGVAFDGAGVRVVRGDVFEFVCNEPFDSVFDRAALVAMTPDQRAAYVAKVLSVLKPGGRVLLVAMEHDLGQGPPFTLYEDDVRALYEGECAVSLIEREDVTRDNQRFVDRGATFVREAAYLIERRPTK
ncbi:MAG: methyltransferase domain-containing protein [Myxococcales bacterium]|nr:methyltransferase domain-containing protein [Myxococcales bacterium]